MEGPTISVSSVSLLVPPLRLMTALMWDVVRRRNVRQYGRVVEFVYLVTEAIPDIMTERQTQLLILALKAKVILMKLHSEQAEDLSSVEAHLARLRSSPSEQAPEANFAKLVERLVEDPERRKHFHKDVYPVEFGSDFDSALEVLVFRFFTRLEERTPVPDFRQAAVWIKDAPSGLAEHMCEEDDLKVLLKSKLCRQRSATMSTKTSLNPSERCLLRTLSLPPSPKQTDTSTHDRFNTEPQISSDNIQDTSTTPQEVAASGADLQSTSRPSEEEAQNVASSDLIGALQLPVDLATRRRTRAAYLCVKCGADFKSIRERFRHRCASEEKPRRFGCPQCGTTFPRMTQTQARSYQCLQCVEARAGMSELGAHEVQVQVQVHAGSTKHKRKTQICEECGKAFESKQILERHMRSHTGEQPFQCTYCGRRFSMRGNLTVHVRIHTGEKPFLCADCGKAFVSAGDLQVHRRTHTGEKPYKCVVCARAFTTASHLTQHRRVHTGERPYVCPVCGKGFSRSVELKQHTFNHSGVRPYACQLCSKTYMCLNHLKRHQTTHSVELTA